MKSHYVHVDAAVIGEGSKGHRPRSSLWHQWRSNTCSQTLDAQPGKVSRPRFLISYLLITWSITSPPTSKVFFIYSLYGAKCTPLIGATLCLYLPQQIWKGSRGTWWCEDAAVGIVKAQIKAELPHNKGMRKLTWEGEEGFATGTVMFQMRAMVMVRP